MAESRKHTPFCFTLSNDITKSESEPGNAFWRCCWGSCAPGGSCDAAAEGGRADPGAACASFVWSAGLSATPGGNWGACSAGAGIGDTASGLTEGDAAG